jgi:KDO2-lipid IV(A) lauroyltransferase
MNRFLDLLGRIPRPVLAAFGAFVGWLAWTLGLRRKVALDNLRLAFPEKSEAERRAIARANYRHLGQMIPDFLRVPTLSPAELDALFVNEGWENLGVAQARGHGVIACTAHYGNFDLLAAAQTRRGTPITMISRVMGRNPFNDLIRAARQRSGVEDLVVQKGQTMRAAIRALKSGRVLGYVFDQNQPVRPVFPTFFGVPAATAATPAYLSRLTGAAVIFTVSVPLGDGRHKVVIEGPYDPPDTGDRDADDLAFMQTLNDRLEHWIRLHPERWYWLHRRWKTRPPAPAAGPPAVPAPAPGPPPEAPPAAN